MKLKRPLYGPDHPKGPTIGDDVVIVKKTLARVETDFFPPATKGGYDDVFNRRASAAVTVLQRLHKIEATGDIGQPTFDVLATYMTKPLKAAYVRFEVPEQGIELVEPAQGFESLHRSLWVPYSQGRHMGLFDLGTYNPAATLPSGRISDHATSIDYAKRPSPPAIAFDLGFDPDTGWNHPVARDYVQLCIKHHVEWELEYVILGDKIWVRGEGVQAYTAGGHLNHVHVSGLRKS